MWHLGGELRGQPDRRCLPANHYGVRKTPIPYITQMPSYISVTNLSGSGTNIANGSFQETYQTAGAINSTTSASYTTLTFSPNGVTPVPIGLYHSSYPGGDIRPALGD